MKAVRTCSMEGCGRPHAAKSLCGLHYRRLWRTGSTERTLAPVWEGPKDECRIEGCTGGRSFWGGYCSAHYNRVRYKGDPGEVVRRNMPRDQFDGHCLDCGIEVDDVSRRRYGYLCVKCRNEHRKAQLAARTEVCEVEGCEKTTYSKHMCSVHYNRMRTKGTTDDPIPRGRRYPTSTGYVQELREKIKAGEIPTPYHVHGTVGGYTTWACRCADCTEAQRVYAIRWRSKKKASS